jgi:flagellar protein FliO/FliZ
MAPGITGADLFRVLGSLALVIALLVLLLWALNRLNIKISSQNAGRKLQVVEILSLGGRQKIALVRVGAKEVLIGISPTQITALTGEMSSHVDPNPDNVNALDKELNEEIHVA